MDLFIDEPKNIANSGFEIIVASSQPIPKSIGTWRAYQDFKDPNDVTRFVERELSATDCDHVQPKIQDFWLKRIPFEMFKVFTSGDFHTCIAKEETANL